VNKRGVFKEFIVLLSMFILVASFASFVFAQTQPEGPDTITYNTSRPTAKSVPTIGAQAGNVTALDITHERITEAWQAYYGNITGTIVLDDANNVTFYDWSLPDPTGEIYAVNSSATVSWTKVYCMNLSHLRPNNGSGGGSGEAGRVVYNINMSQIELNFGINNSLGGTADDSDGLNETFNDTFDGNFDVGAINIDITDGCSEAHPFQDENHNTDWDEILLTDNSSLIFTAIIRSDQDMYKTSGAKLQVVKLLISRCLYWKMDM
jgi:hypothetical protein